MCIKTSIYTHTQFYEPKLEMLQLLLMNMPNVFSSDEYAP